eukprot:7988748-Pyramimonas_sp.AAC.1
MACATAAATANSDPMRRTQTSVGIAGQGFLRRSQNLVIHRLPMDHSMSCMRGPTCPLRRS